MILPILLFNNFAAAGCNLNTYYKIVKINKNQDQKLIKETNCSEKINSIFVNFISNAKGALNGRHLSNYFKKEHSIEIDISPNEFHVLSFQDLLIENLNNDNISLKSVTSLYSQSSFNLNKGDSIRVQCSNCDTAGNKNIVTFVNSKKIWLSAKLHVKRNGYILIKPIQNLKQKLDKSYFKLVTIADNGTQMLFQDIENIKFFKFNRLLKHNEIVKKYDLQPRLLIKYGQRVKVLLQNQNIQLNTVATSRGRGFLGDSIELMNLKTKKTIMARISDYNSAVIEL
jgi:flagella basal body P-ring formation protein FlgA